MIKKMCMIMLLGFVSFCVFAQDPPQQVLSKADIDNFIKNFPAIQQLLDAHEEELSPLLSDLDGSNGAELTAALIKIRGFAVSPDVKSGLSEFGLGNNGFEKVIVIMHGMGVIFVEQVLQITENQDPGLIQMLQEQIKPLKDAIHVNDISLLLSRGEDLMPLVEY